MSPRFGWINEAFNRQPNEEETSVRTVLTTVNAMLQLWKPLTEGRRRERHVMLVRKNWICESAAVAVEPWPVRTHILITFETC